MNDKTRQRQKRGREPDEKTIFVCGAVRGWLLATKLWYSLVKRYLVATAVFNRLYKLTGNWLASSQSQKRLVVSR